MTAFIVDPFFLEEIVHADLVTCDGTVKWYEALLFKYVLSALQERQCVDPRIFIQDGSPPHIATPVKQLMSAYFGYDRIISRRFPIIFLQRKLVYFLFFGGTWRMLFTMGG